MKIDEAPSYVIESDARATLVARAKDGAEKPHYDTHLSST